jgi:hypothetical protein
MKKTCTQLAILVMVVLILFPVSVAGQNTSNSTVNTTTTVTDTVSPVTTPVPSETTTIVQVNTTATAIPVTTTLPPVTTTAPVPSTTTTTGAPVTVETEATEGTVSVASTPLGASILIDGVYYGVTPGNVTGIEAGNHIVRLALSGYYDYEGTMYVVPGQVTNVFGTLPPLSGYYTSPSTVPSTAVPVTTTITEVTVKPTETASAGPFENPTVVAAIIGVITACIGAGATIYPHLSKTKKE